jgi:hypothetical protein
MESPTAASGHRPRIALTENQLQSPVAIELLSLLQSVTADGTVTDEEVAELQQWLTANASEPVPALQHLRSVLEKALADGRISPEERKWIHSSLEACLPRDLRQEAVVRRREAAAEARRKAAESRGLENVERAKPRPSSTFDFMVAGTR